MEGFLETSVQCCSALLGHKDVHRKIRNMPVVLFLSVACTAQQILLLRNSLISPDYFRLPPQIR